MKIRIQLISLLIALGFTSISVQNRLAAQTLVGKSIKTSHAPQSRDYAENSVLASGKFYKISVKESGIYKISYESLKNMGLDPENVRIYGYGGALLEQDLRNDAPDDLPEVAIWMEKGSDAVFNAGDYILFYGVGVNNWKYNQSGKRFYHKLNHYANYGYYFITSDKGAGKRISETISTMMELIPILKGQNIMFSLS